MAIDFFTEYKKLQLETPRFSSFILSSENSNYNYNVKDAKNCYLIANGVDDENCMYGRDFYGCDDCVDCDHVGNCTLCYQCLNCDNCYNCSFLQDSVNCNDCDHGYFLKGCKDCVGCVGLKQKRFCIFNEQYSEQEYREKVKSLDRKLIAEKFLELKKSTPRVFSLQIDCENVSGDNIYHSRNVFESYDANECQDAGYLLESKKCSDCWDISIGEQMELCYQISACHIMHNCNFCFFCTDCSNVEYGEFLIACHDCFGCVSLHRKQYYILNQPYSADEYFKKVAEYKDQLREQGLYGKYILPPSFPREETVVIWDKM